MFAANASSTGDINKIGVGLSTEDFKERSCGFRTKIHYRCCTYV